MTPRIGFALSVLLLLTEVSGPGNSFAAPEREPVVGGRCEGCDLIFAGMPDSVTSQTRIAPADEPGEPLRIEGRVLDSSGEPVPGIIVYAYHTDAEGIYPGRENASGPGERQHGALRAWARTDPQGRYRFLTIRPASYPDSRNPQHVHMHVLEPGCCTYWIDSIHFRDDPLLSPNRGDEQTARGGSGVVSPKREKDGTWVVVRDIVLGQNVPGRPDAKTPPGLD